MRITRVTADVVSLGRCNAIFVRVYTDTDLVGLGETVIKRRDFTVRQNVEEMAPFLVERDPLRIEDIAEKLYRDSFWVGGALHAAGRSAVDMALWDIKGQYYHAPVYDLLGGLTRPHVLTYCHCAAGETPAEFAANLRACQARGYRAAKTTLPLFYGSRGEAPLQRTGYSGLPGNLDRSLKETEYLPTRMFDDVASFFAAGRQAVGPDFELMLDCHGRLSVANAIRLCELLAPYRLLFVEEPIPPESAEDLAAVASRSGTPIAAGERVTGLYEARAFLEKRALGVLQCDLATCGGFTGAKKIAALAEAHYVAFAPHNPNGPVNTLASAHLLSAIPNALILETVGSQADAERFAELVDSPPHVAGGLLTLSDRPGIGARLREDAPQRFPAEPFAGWR